jgi:uncharacterized membrane protein YbhN (UPF0104 family)
VRNKRFVKLVAVLITLALVYYAFFVVLPSEISWAQVSAALQALTGAEIMALVLSGVVLMVLLGWAAKASLPGLSLYQGFESSATSQMTAFVVPPPGDYLIRFSMYRTYGFSEEQSGASVLVSMVLRYVAIFVMPILGLLAVVVAGIATTKQVWWLVGLTTAFVIVVWLMLRVIRSDAVAHRLGRWLDSAVARVLGLFHRTAPGDVEGGVVGFGHRMRATVNSNGLRLLISNLAWALGNAAILLMAMRFSGLDSSTVPLATALLACGFLMVVNILPIPGKSALAAPTLFTIMSLTTNADQSDMLAAILLYRVVTWLLPMPVGGLMFFVWRYRVRRDTVTTVSEGAEDLATGLGAKGAQA